MKYTNFTVHFIKKLNFLSSTSEFLLYKMIFFLIIHLHLQTKNISFMSFLVLCAYLLIISCFGPSPLLCLIFGSICFQSHSAAACFLMASNGAWTQQAAKTETLTFCKATRRYCLYFFLYFPLLMFILFYLFKQSNSYSDHICCMNHSAVALH